MTKTQRFTKKPVTIEASQWFKHGDHPEVTTIPADHPIDRNCIDPSAFGWVQTLEGGHVVSPGDWIIKGVKGEFYPCKPDIFAMTYDAEAQQPAQAAADARDAERYRWLRSDDIEVPDGQREISVVLHRLPFSDDPDITLIESELDAAIDAALTAQELTTTDAKGGV